MTARDRYDVVIVGGGYAGVTAANRLPRGLRVVLVDPKPAFVHRIRLHELAAGGRPRVAVPFRHMLHARIEHRLATATWIEQGAVRLDDGTTLRARQILVSTGSDQAPTASIGAYAAATATAARLAQAPAGASVLVVGAGLTGIELAAELAYRRPEIAVRLGGRRPVGADLPERARDGLRDGLRRLGVEIDVDIDDHCDRDTSIRDVSIDTTGFHRSPLAGASRLDVDDVGRLRVDTTLAAAPGIWGAGDAVAVEGRPELRASCAVAIPMGAHAARNIAAALGGSTPTAFGFRFRVRCISLGRRDGLILALDPSDTPTGRHLRGLPAAGVKAAVVAGALHTARR